MHTLPLWESDNRNMRDPRGDKLQTAMVIIKGKDNCKQVMIDDRLILECYQSDDINQILID